MNPLLGVVQGLSPEAKKAMYAAASHGLIKRGTWAGCAFNKAGTEVGTLVNGNISAARAFNMPSLNVGRFISKWDNLQGTDAHCTRLLMEALDEVGICTPIVLPEPTVRVQGTNVPRAMKSHESRVLREVHNKVYISQATKFKEQLDSGELTVDMIPGCKEMGQLLSAVC